MSKDIDPMHIVNLTIHNVGFVRIQPDPENGCLDIHLFDSAKNYWTKFRILAFGPNDTVPGIDLAEPVEPEEEEHDNVASFLGEELA